MMSKIRWYAVALLAGMVAGCSANNLISRVPPSPHERYAASLRGANLGDTALGRDWIQASERALTQPLSVTLPLNESGYFPADIPSAVGYRLDLQRGRVLHVDLTFDGLQFPRLFVDLFEARDAVAPARVASLSEGTTLTFEVPRDGAYVLRVQPELLRSGRFTVMQRTLASLPFPVRGLTAASVQSEFGAARDAGRREHEGIDIFAARDTPVVAVVAGIAAAGTNTLGGNVVWLRGRGGPSYYYAHLQRAAFEGPSTVQVGDIVGYVGNSGNARTTSPHLHFGIYDRGAVDPFPFVRADDPLPEVGAAAEHVNELVRVTAKRTALRSGPAQTAAVTTQLNRGSLARAVGATGAQLRVVLPDRSVGYVDRSAVALAQKPLRQQRLAVGTIIRDHPLPNAPAVVTFEQVTTADVLGDFNGFNYVRTSAARYGWVAG